MSNTDDMRIWIGDLDGYVNLNDIDYSNQREAEDLAFHAELDEIGDILLLSNNIISAYEALSRPAPPDKWRWAVYEAEKAIGNAIEWPSIERILVKKLLDIGRRYAIARYARAEQLPLSTALTAALPYGINALLDQFVKSEPLLQQKEKYRILKRSLLEIRNKKDISAYAKTGLFRGEIYKMSSTYNFNGERNKLRKDVMRTILSSVRLYFSIYETKHEDFFELNSIYELYSTERMEAFSTADWNNPVSGKYINGWQLRHLHPLLFFYPKVIREAMQRGSDHDNNSIANYLNRQAAVNEIALAYYNLELIHQRAKAAGGK